MALGHNATDTEETDEMVKTEKMPNKNKPAPHRPTDPGHMNMKGVFLHVLSDALGEFLCIAIIVSLLGKDLPKSSLFCAVIVVTPSFRQCVPVMAAVIWDVQYRFQPVLSKCMTLVLLVLKRLVQRARLLERSLILLWILTNDIQ